MDQFKQSIKDWETSKIKKYIKACKAYLEIFNDDGTKTKMEVAQEELTNRNK